MTGKKNNFLKDNSEYAHAGNGEYIRNNNNHDVFKGRGFKDFLERELSGKTVKDFAEKENIFIFPDPNVNPAGIDKKSIILELRQTWAGKLLHTGNIVGILGDGNGHTLRIKSRFSADGVDDNEENDFFFQYMLEKALDYPFMIDLFSSEYKEAPDMLDWLMLLFPKMLKDAVRKGLFKQYVKREYNDANVRGVIDVKRHIRQNVPFLGKIAYNQREHTVDNELMQLIRHTIEFIKTKNNGQSFLANAKDEVAKVIEATPTYSQGMRRRILVQNENKPVRHAYYHEYRELQKLCIGILKHSTIEIGDGDDDIWGILFDCSWLWEEYINTLIRNKFHHPENKAEKGKQYLFTEKREDDKDKQEGLIYPDFIGKEPAKRIIADAKYKHEGGIGRENHDYFQILSYMFRFDSNTGYLIHPFDKDDEKGEQGNHCELFLNRGTTFEDNVVARNGDEEVKEEVKVIKLGMKIPQESKDYEKFRNKMKKQEESLKKELQIK